MFKIPDGYINEQLADIANGLNRHKCIIPTTGLSTSVTGSGVVTQTPSFVYISSGATASSTAIAYAKVFGVAIGGGTIARVDYSKLKRVSFSISSVNVANSIKYLQIKTATTAGDLATKGVGIKINNMTVYGETYGTSRETVELMTITSYKEYAVTIDISASSIDFYIDGVLKGSITTAASIPSGETAGDTYVLGSSTNGATASNSPLYASAVLLIVEV